MSEHMDIRAYLGTEDEKPLERMLTAGGLCGIFRRIACVGDSLSTGAMEGYPRPDGIQNMDCFENRAAGTKDAPAIYQMILHDEQNACLDAPTYSFGQQMARLTGATVYNFSQGGMSAREYCKHFADRHDLWNPDKICQAYIFALGVNDLKGIALGTVEDSHEDYTQNADTFAGWFGQILTRYRQISPDAKFFLVTQPIRGEDPQNKTEERDGHAALMYDFAARDKNTYVIDLRKYAPVYDEEFHRHFYLGGHLNASGYLFTAQMMISYIDYIIRHNPEDFRYTALIGTNYVK